MPTAVKPLSTAVGGCLVLALAVGIGRFLLTPVLPPMMLALELGPRFHAVESSKDAGVPDDRQEDREDPRPKVTHFLHGSGLVGAA